MYLQYKRAIKQFITLFTNDLQSVNKSIHARTVLFSGAFSGIESRWNLIVLHLFSSVFFQMLQINFSVSL